MDASPDHSAIWHRHHAEHHSALKGWKKHTSGNCSSRGQTGTGYRSALGRTTGRAGLNCPPRKSHRLTRADNPGPAVAFEPPVKPSSPVIELQPSVSGSADQEVLVSRAAVSSCVESVNPVFVTIDLEPRFIRIGLQSVAQR